MSQEIRLRCPRCGREVVLSGRVLRDAAERARASGLYSVAFSHGDHVVIVFIDESGKVRSLITADAVQKDVQPAGVEAARRGEEEAQTLLAVDIIPIPSKSPPPLSSLPREERLVFDFCDGNATVREISKKLSMPYGKIMRIVQTLYGRGYIRELRQASVK